MLFQLSSAEALNQNRKNNLEGIENNNNNNNSNQKADSYPSSVVLCLPPASRKRRTGSQKDRKNIPAFLEQKGSEAGEAARHFKKDLNRKGGPACKTKEGEEYISGWLIQAKPFDGLQQWLFIPSVNFTVLLWL